jgi:D-alanine-D-alanine ligase
MNPHTQTQEWQGVKSAAEFGKVAVLYGGSSAERDVSLMSGQAVFNGLQEKGVNVSLIDLQGYALQNLLDEQFDRVWIALHGRGGEDGSVQGALELLGVPYTGSGILGSALCMDKLRAKQIFTALGLPTPKWLVVDATTNEQDLLAAIGLPMVIKPSNEGSSIGMSIVTQEEALAQAIQDAVQLDTSVIAEQYIEGQELTASVLHDKVLPIIHIETPRSFYDYEAKYFSDNTRYHCPAGLSAAVADEISELSLHAFKALDATGWGRVDFMLDAGQKPWILEVNTVPGMTSHSLVPMAAAALGISFSDLVWKVLETSMPKGVSS